MQIPRYLPLSDCIISIFNAEMVKNAKKKCFCPNFVFLSKKKRKFKFANFSTRKVNFQPSLASVGFIHAYHYSTAESRIILNFVHIITRIAHAFIHSFIQISSSKVKPGRAENQRFLCFWFLTCEICGILRVRQFSYNQLEQITV